MYDLIILGGGPGGYHAADLAGSAGLSTLLIEKNRIGGVCLNEGCIPFKTFLNSAKIFDHARNGQKYGIVTETASIDQGVVVARKNKVVRILTAGVRNSLKTSGVTVLEGSGFILGRVDNVIRVAVHDEIFESRRLLIATGSENLVPAISGVREGLDNGHILTSREIVDLQTIPESLAIIGGGIVGLEMADYFQTCGAQVTIIERLDHVAGSADFEIAGVLQKAFEKKGIRFCMNSEVLEVRPGIVKFKKQDEIMEVEAACTLLSAGRRPVVHDFGLENLGLVAENGRIVTDCHCRTGIPDVFAVGDVNGIWMLAHTAYREAAVAINTILGKPDTICYDAVPSVLYTNPEMAFVGETEESCRRKGLACKKIVLPMTYSGRYVAEQEGGSGLIKILVDPVLNCLLGCHLLGSYASELIISAEMMIKSKMKLNEIKELIFPHPTVGEIFREAVFRI